MNAAGRRNERPINFHVVTDKIVINYYNAKSRAEFKKILRLTCDEIIPTFCDELKIQQRWEFRTALLDLQKFLRLIK